jgi:hypothetical protein
MSYEVYSVSSSLAPCPPAYLQVAMRCTVLHCVALCCSVSYYVAILPPPRQHIAQCMRRTHTRAHRTRSGKQAHARAQERTQSDANGYVVRMALKRTDSARRRCGRQPSRAIRRNTTRQEHVHARTHTKAGTGDDDTTGTGTGVCVCVRVQYTHAHQAGSSSISSIMLSARGSTAFAKVGCFRTCAAATGRGGIPTRSARTTQRAHGAAVQEPGPAVGSVPRPSSAD